MTHNHGRNTPAGAAIVAVDIASADSTGSNPDQDLLRTDFRIGEIPDLQVSILFKGKRLQKIKDNL
jgi:hypothetical protein